MPVCTSSYSSSAPWRSHSSRASSSHARSIGHTPPSPWIGSTSTAQVSGPTAARERVEVVARHVLEAGGHGLERLALGGRPAGRERRQRAAVKGALDAHDAVLGRPAARAPRAARELDRGLDRLGARVAEERAVLARERAQALGERDRGLAVEEVRDVAEHGGLRGERLHGGGMAVSERADREPGRRGRGRRCRPRPRRCSRRRARARAAARGRSAGSRPRRDRAGSWRHHRPGDADADPRDAARAAPPCRPRASGSMPPLALAGGREARDLREHRAAARRARRARRRGRRARRRRARRRSRRPSRRH